MDIYIYTIHITAIKYVLKAAAESSVSLGAHSRRAERSQVRAQIQLQDFTFMAITFEREQQATIQAYHRNRHGPRIKDLGVDTVLDMVHIFRIRKY